MVVKCSICGKWYDDAKRNTLCPHPGIHEPGWREIIANWDKDQEEQNKLAFKMGEQIADQIADDFIADTAADRKEITETTSLHNKNFKSFSPSGAYSIDRLKLIAILDKMGLTEVYGSNRIVFDINCEGEVRVYTRALLKGKQIDDIFNILLEE